MKKVNNVHGPAVLAFLLQQLSHAGYRVHSFYEGIKPINFTVVHSMAHSMNTYVLSPPHAIPRFVQCILISSLSTPPLPRFQILACLET